MNLTVKLPLPPSLNNAFVNVGRRRIKSRAYKIWLAEAGTSIMAARPMAFLRPVQISIIATPPDSRRRDLDNLIKPILDLLVHMGVLPDDNHHVVRRIVAQWAPRISRDDAHVSVTISSFEDERSEPRQHATSQEAARA